MKTNSNSALFYAYPIQFEKSVDEAKAHLVQLISDGVCGYEGGKAHHVTEIRALLNSEGTVTSESIHGFPFETDEFRKILLDVVHHLEGSCEVR